jgi:DNA polymerase
MRLAPGQVEYLNALGIEVYKLRERESQKGTGLKPVPGHGSDLTSGPGSTLAAGVLEQADSASPEGIAAQPGDGVMPDWETLQREVSECRLCPLHEGRTQTVFGVGDVNADWMLIGEAPGAEEDRRGEPFVGRAGKLLDSMLKALGLDRQQVFIANILKCRPPNNRDPRPEEVLACANYLNQQINTVKPRLIIALGRVAAQKLLKTETPIGKMRGKRFHYGDPPVPVVVTYHPAYLLRSPREKRKSWQDLQLAMSIYKEQT